MWRGSEDRGCEGVELLTRGGTQPQKSRLQGSLRLTAVRDAKGVTSGRGTHAILTHAVLRIAIGATVRCTHWGPACSQCRCATAAPV